MGWFVLAGCVPQQPAKTRTPTVPIFDGMVGNSNPIAGWPTPELPDNPTQADLGAKQYWLVCMVCHGNNGQGLTDDWRAMSGQEDMNCWQSKCHAPNHPPDGFEFPKYVPPVIGPFLLIRFNTAKDLHDDIADTMPWWAPGSLTDEQYWELTAFLLRENGVSLDSDLGESNAKKFKIPRY